MLETILLQLQAEVDKSKKFQDELRNIKESVNDLDKTFHQENKHVRLTFFFKLEN